MTETEAYNKLGWPHDGLVNGRPTLVLPLSGSESTNWMAIRCTECVMVGVTLPHAFTKVCFSCGGAQEEIP